MEIHAPDRPVRSFKDFALHIAIVTIGILIALGLEGVREVVHDRQLVRETRENFDNEIRQDLDNADDEYRQVRHADEQLKALTADLPELSRSHPELISQRLDQVVNPGYFFSDSTWQAALSTGALAHMSTAELGRYASAFSGMRNYIPYQAAALTAETRAKIFFASHPELTPAERAEGTERILLFANAEQSIRWVGFQMRNDLRVAAGRPQADLSPGDRPGPVSAVPTRPASSKSE